VDGGCVVGGGQAAMLHSRSRTLKARAGHGSPPLAAGVFTERNDCCLPVAPHALTLHRPKSVQSFITQLTAAGGVVGGGRVHAGAEHARVRVQDAASGHHPPLEAGVTKVCDDFCSPIPPQATEHAVHSLHADKVQFTGTLAAVHGGVPTVQFLTSVHVDVLGHGWPPLEAKTNGSRCRV